MASMEENMDRVLRLQTLAIPSSPSTGFVTASQTPDSSSSPISTPLSVPITKPYEVINPPQHPISFSHSSPIIPLPHPLLIRVNLPPQPRSEMSVVSESFPGAPLLFSLHSPVESMSMAAKVIPTISHVPQPHSQLQLPFQFQPQSHVPQSQSQSQFQPPFQSQPFIQTQTQPLPNNPSPLQPLIKGLSKARSAQPQVSATHPDYHLSQISKRRRFETNEKEKGLIERKLLTKKTICTFYSVSQRDLPLLSNEQLNKSSTILSLHSG